MSNQQTLEQVLALYNVGEKRFNNIQRAVIADLFAMPEFQAMPKEWVSPDSGHRYDYNTLLPITLEYIEAKSSPSADSTSFDPEGWVCALLKIALDKFEEGSARLVLLAREADDEDKELYLYYKAEPITA